MYSQADALRWCISIAKALHYLHTANPKVIHRDLKLDNVLLTDRDVSLATAKLADFGLAKLLARSHKGQQKQLSLQKLVSKSAQELLPLDRARSVSVKKVMLSLDSMSWTTTTAASSITTATTLPLPPSAFSSESVKLPEQGKEHPPTGGNTSATSLQSSGSGNLHDMTGEAGSYSYMAPEVLRGEQYNEKADIFSFAMLMYNLFYRVIPSVLLFANGGQSEDMSMLAWETANGYRPKLSTTGMIPDSVHAVITECWHGVPEMRPSAKEVLEKLMKIQESGVCTGSGGKSKTTTSNGKASGTTGCACTLM
jgi:serine/threonine protein kinase